MPILKFRSLIAAAALAVAGANALAAQYLVVVPVPGRLAAPHVGPAGPTLSAGQLAFGARQLGDAGLPLALTLTNPGPTALTIGDIGLGGSSAQDGFSLQHSCGTLEATRSCTAYVYYRPVQSGAHVGDLLVSHDGWRQSTKVPLTGTGRIPSATLTGLSFGDVNVDSAKDQVSVLTNTGVGSITVGTPVVSGDGFTFIGSDCPSPLSPAESCSITTRFTAKTPAPVVGKLSVPSGAGALQANLAGIGVSSDLTFATGPVAAFGSVSTGTWASSKLVTLTNIGNRPAAALALDVGSTGAYAIEDSSCGTTLAAAASCSFTVKFAPVAPGAYAADLVATVDGKEAASSPLSGVGTSAAVFLTSSVQNSVVLVGTTNAEYYTVTNSSSSPVAITSKRLSHPEPALTYTMAGGTSECASMIPAKSSCRINIALQASDMFSSKPMVITLGTSAGQLTASTMGVSASWAKLTTVPANPTFDFGNVVLGTSVTSVKVSVTNAASSPAANSVTYTVPEGFEMVSSSCGASSVRTSVCELYLKFSPTAAKAYKGTFTMSTRTSYNGNGGTPQPYTLSIPLSGVGVAPATLGWQGGQLDVVEVGVVRATKLTLYNPGPSSVALGAVTLAGNPSEFRLAGTTCAATLAAASSCVATLEFEPSAAGARPAAVVSVTVNGVAVTKSVTGTAGIATFTSTPSSLAFSSRYAAGDGKYDAFHDIKLTLKNTGIAAAENLTGSVVYNGTGTGLQFSFQYNSCTKRLNAGSSCTTNVRAIGTIEGTYTGAVVFKSASGTIQIPFTFSVVPVLLDIVTVTPVKDTAVGQGTVSTYTLTTSNVGKVIVDVPTISGNQAEYSLAAGSNCSGIMQLNTKCTVNILFTPTAAGPRPPATLVMKFGGLTRTVNLAGAGIPAP